MLSHTLMIVSPVFLLIGIGYLLAKANVIGQSVGDALGQFVHSVAIPVLIFQTLTKADLSGGLPIALWATYFTGVASVWTMGTLVVRRGLSRDARSGAIGGISSSFANTILVGLPLVSAVYGEEGLVPLLLIVSIHLATMTVAMAIIMEKAAARDSGQTSPPMSGLVVSAGRSLIKNPLVLTILAAFFWRMTGMEMPTLGTEVLSRIGGTALPLALLSLGMSLVQYGVRGNILPGVLLGAIKIFVMPAIVFLAGSFVFHLPPLWTVVATLTAACPTGVNAYIFANRYGTGHAMSANAITITTLCAIGTTSLWIWFLNEWFGLG